MTELKVPLIMNHDGTLTAGVAALERAPRAPAWQDWQEVPADLLAAFNDRMAAAPSVKSAKRLLREQIHARILKERQ